ncbi:hypothetical protein D3C71_2071570 [compost metagenome]
MLQQLQAVCILERRVSIGKMPADIAKPQSPQDGIADCVQQHIRIGVAQQPLFIRNRYTANNTRSSLYQLVYIKTLSYSYHA